MNEPEPTQVRIELRDLVKRAWKEGRLLHGAPSLEYIDSIIDSWYEAWSKADSDETDASQT